MDSLPFRRAVRAAFALSLPALLGLQGCNLFGSSDSKGSGTPPTNRGYFKISSPLAGWWMRLDSTQAIGWSTSEGVEIANVRVTLHRGGKLLATLSPSTANSGTFGWRPASFGPASGYRIGTASDYRIRIASASDTGQWEFSGAFSLYTDYKGSVDVTAPAAGARVRMDSSYSIRWTASGNVGSPIGIQLFKDTLLVSNLSLSASANGYYLWANPGAALAGQGSGDDYRVRVFSMDDPGISSLSRAFSVVSAYSGSFTVTSPAAGDTLVAGTARIVEWSATGAPGASVRVALLRDSTLVTTLSSSAQPAGTLTWTPSLGLASSDRYRIRVSSLSDPGILAYSGYFSVKGVDADAYEADDTQLLAKPIPATGAAQQRTLTAQDNDWVAFPASAGKRYLVSARSSALSLYLSLYDSSGTLLQSAGLSPAPQSILAPARSGRHFARVYPGSSGYGAYVLSVTEYDSTESPWSIRFTAPDAKTTWAAGSVYTIQYTPDSLAYGSLVSLALYQDSLLIQTIASGTGNSGSHSWSIPAGTFTSDRYRIRVMSYGNSQVFAYSPAFTISGVTPDDYEPDNARAAAKPLAADGKAQARNLTTGDVDWIRFQAEAGKRYVAAFNASPGSVYGYVHDSAGVQLSSQSGPQFPLILNPAYSGTYHLRVLPYSSIASSAAYTVSLVAYDSSQGGFPVRFSAPDSATTWAAGSAYTLNWTGDAALFGATVSLSLYLDSAFVRSIVTGIANSGSYSWSVPVGLASSGRYRIRLASYSSPAIWGYSARFAISGIAPDAYEPDNARAAAKSIATDGAAQQRNLALGDTDWVSFDAAVGKSYLVTAASASSVNLHLLDSLGSLLNSTSGTRPTLLLNPIRSGRHFARVQYASATGAYTLSVASFVPDGGGVPAKFTAPAESTTWAAGSAYAAAWTPDSALFGPYVNLALYRDTTLVLGLASSATNSGTASVPLPAALGSSSRYRLRLSNSSNTQIFGYGPFFTVSGLAPDSLEPNDSAAAARELAPNTGRRNLSLSYRDRDWFKFTAKAQMLYVIQAVSPATLHTTVRLYSGLGTGLLLTNSKNSSLDSLNTMSYVPAADGVHSILVEPYSVTYSGGYGFELKEIDPAGYRFGVTSPAAQTSVRLGTSLTITWTDPAALKGTVDIFLYDASGVVLTVAAGVANSGSYAWSVPTTLTAKPDYTLRINSRTSSAVFGTSGTFALVP